MVITFLQHITEMSTAARLVSQFFIFAVFDVLMRCSLIGVINYVFSADRTNGTTYATVLRLLSLSSVCRL